MTGECDTVINFVKCVLSAWNASPSLWTIGSWLKWKERLILHATPSRLGQLFIVIMNRCREPKPAQGCGGGLWLLTCFHCFCGFVALRPASWLKEPSYLSNHPSTFMIGCPFPFCIFKPQNRINTWKLFMTTNLYHFSMTHVWIFFNLNTYCFYLLRYVGLPWSVISEEVYIFLSSYSQWPDTGCTFRSGSRSNSGNNNSHAYWTTTIWQGKSNFKDITQKTTFTTTSLF